MDKKKVSVIVPVYNQEKYLGISIPSILNQKYANLEIILIDDGSTDNSYTILQKYAQTDNRIVFIRKENGGLVDATLVGIREATGDYIVFLDPDDRLGRDFISNFMNIMEEDNYDFVSAGFYVENGKSIEEVFLESDQIFDQKRVEWLRSHYLISANSSLPSKITFHSRWNKMYKSNVVKEVATEFANYKEITFGEDNIFTYIFFSHSQKGRAVSRPNSYYYNIGNQNSMMNNSSIEEYCFKVKDVYKKYRNLMLKNNDELEQADMLYYSFMTALLNKAVYRKENFVNVYKYLYKDTLYRKILKRYIHREKSLKIWAGLMVRYFVPFPNIYLLLSGKKGQRHNC